MAKFAGMFREFGPVGLDVVQESILDNIAPVELPDLDDVVRYLKSGHLLISTMDIADDIFDRSRQVMNGSSILTDGDWLWRDDLAYYVKRHRVEVPAELLTTIRERNYVVPSADEAVLRELALTAEDLMF